MSERGTYGPSYSSCRETAPCLGESLVCRCFHPKGQRHPGSQLALSLGCWHWQCWEGAGMMCIPGTWHCCKNFSGTQAPSHPHWPPGWVSRTFLDVFWWISHAGVPVPGSTWEHHVKALGMEPERGSGTSRFHGEIGISGMGREMQHSHIHPCIPSWYGWH